jgi:hypothetical protein
MILGTIAALGAGVFSDMANDFSSVNTDDSQMELLKTLVNCKNEEEITKLAGGNEDKAWTYLILYNLDLKLKFFKNE